MELFSRRMMKNVSAQEISCFVYDKPIDPVVYVLLKELHARLINHCIHRLIYVNICKQKFKFYRNLGRRTEARTFSIG